MAEAKGGEVQARAVWVDTEDPEPTFADEVYIQGIGDRFYLTFGQVRLPLAAEEGPVTAQIRAVARLIVPKESLKRIVEVLSRTVSQAEGKEVKGGGP
jgi:hypothetical protein